MNHLTERLEEALPVFACGFPCESYMERANTERKEAASAIKKQVECLRLAERALDGALRSAGTSPAGYIAMRKLLAKAHNAVSERLRDENQT